MGLDILTLGASKKYTEKSMDGVIQNLPVISNDLTDDLKSAYDGAVSKMYEDMIIHPVQRILQYYTISNTSRRILCG